VGVGGRGPVAAATRAARPVRRMPWRGWPRPYSGRPQSCRAALSLPLAGVGALVCRAIAVQARTGGESMRIWGKLIGFMIGLVVTRGDFGAAVLGLVIGHLVFDSGWLAGLTHTGGKDGY